MKEVIKRLEEEKNRLELRVTKISRIIGELEEMSTDISTDIGTHEKEKVSVPKRGEGPLCSAVRKVKSSVWKRHYKKRGRPRKERPNEVYTPAVIRHLKMIARTLNMDEIMGNMREKFGIETRKPALRMIMARHGIKLQVRKKSGPKEMATPGYPKPIIATNKAAKKKSVGRGGHKRWPEEVRKYVMGARKHCTVAEMAEEIRSTYKLDIDNKKLSKWMWANNIKSEIHKRKKTEGPYKRHKEPKIFTKEVLDLMRECSKTMTRQQTIEEMQRKFQHPFKPNSVTQAAQDNNIKFASKADIEVQCDRETFELIKKHRKLTAEEIRDKIIEKTGKNTDIGVIRSILRRLESNGEMEVPKKELDKEEESQGMDEESVEATEDFFGDEDPET